MNKKKITLVGSQHGNERLGEVLITYIRANHMDLLPYVDYILANPQAHAAGVRYLESDMNRGYVASPVTAEERQAAQLIKRLHRDQPDVILDLHTTRCIQPPSYIVYAPNAAARDYIDHASIGRIVHMSPVIAQQSLIGVHNATVAIEIQDDTITDDLLEQLAGDIRNYLQGETKGGIKEHYEVTGHILKDSISLEDVAALRNFELSPAGYYPILTGNNSYKKNTNYLGFAARRIKGYPVDS